MTFDVQVRRAAELDIAVAQLWYETQRSGLGAEACSEVARSLTDSLKLRSFTKWRIETFRGQLFIASRISSGIEFLAK